MIKGTNNAVKKVIIKLIPSVETAKVAPILPIHAFFMDKAASVGLLLNAM
jgi:hypothetical protein